jgi:dienelactone hydrolase
MTTRLQSRPLPPTGDLAFSYFPDSYRWSHGALLALGAIPWGGGEVDEINRIGLRLKDRVGDDEAWFTEWSAEAQRLEAIGLEKATQGYAHSAAAYLFRAASYYHVGERFLQPKTDVSQKTYRRGVEVFRKASGLVNRPRIEHVEVPYGGSTLPGIIVHREAPAGNAEPGPVMVFLDGFDVTKELQYFKGVPDLAARGVSCLLLDGPGNGEAIRFRDFPLHHETERHAGAAYDFLAARPEFDAARIGVMGISLGGYYAPRAASCDPRFACCISWGPEWDYYGKWQERLARIERGEMLSLSVPWQHLLWVFGVETKEQAFAKLEGFRLDGVIQKMQCPYLLMHGEGDEQAPLWHAEKMIAAAGSKNKTLRIFTRDEGGYHHCQVDNTTIGVHYMWDWAADVLVRGKT